MPGITSACAEQTPWQWVGVNGNGDHLRVCGADCALRAAAVSLAGSPPRVRSRQQCKIDGCDRPGITSACAEQTSSISPLRPRPGDHLRVCGADVVASRVYRSGRGSPPRVRSRRGATVPRPRLCGITSACAEQTKAFCKRPRGTWDHLRVCGADFSRQYLRTVWTGSPPRVRSRLMSSGFMVSPFGITSACAEQTTIRRMTGGNCTDHLRVCGADTAIIRANNGAKGSPPRVRSRHRPGYRNPYDGGITSACAEQTYRFFYTFRC